jgi:hypothetical protein
VLVGPALVQDSWLVGEAAADAANGMAATGMALIAITAAAEPNRGVRRVMLIFMANSFDRSVSFSFQGRPLTFRCRHGWPPHDVVASRNLHPPDSVSIGRIAASRYAACAADGCRSGG